MGEPLYAAIEGVAEVWRVVGFRRGAPLMVCVGEYVRPVGDFAVEYRPKPMRGGVPRRAGVAQRIIYSPDMLSLVGVIEPWIREVSDAE